MRLGPPPPPPKKKKEKKTKDEKYDLPALLVIQRSENEREQVDFKLGQGKDRTSFTALNVSVAERFVAYRAMRR